MLFHELLAEAAVPRKPFTVTVFHGTDASFRRFDAELQGSAQESAPINMAGFNFTDSREAAATFGKRIIRATLRIETPYVVDANGRSHSDFKHILNDRLHALDRSKYDTIIIRRYADAGIHGDTPIESTHYIPLDPGRISIVKTLAEAASAGGAHDGDAYFDMTAETLRPMLGEMSRETLVHMSPQEFLGMARDGSSPVKAAVVRKLLKKGTRFSSLPFLGFVHDGKGHARVVRHEGRHRAEALAALGVHAMPVVLVSLEGAPGQAIRWGSQHRPAHRVEPFPQALEGEDGRASMPMPRSLIFPQAG